VNFHVLVLSPPQYLHSAAFTEVAESLHHGLRALGHDSVLTHGLEPLAGRRVIVLGANLLPKLQLALPGDALLYNLEQV